MDLKLAYWFRRKPRASGRIAPAKEALDAAREDIRAGRYYHAREDLQGLRFIGAVTPETPVYDLWDSRKTCGWYAGPLAGATGELCRGEVYQLPARKGRARFIAAHRFIDCDCGPVFDLSTVYEQDKKDYYVRARGLDAAREAAFAADRIAEWAAEREYAHQTAVVIGHAYADAMQDIKEARKSALEAIAQFKDARAALRSGGLAESRFTRLCELIRGDVSDFRETIREARETMRKALMGDGPGGLCVYMGPDAQRAFCYGAGLESFPA